MLHLTVSHTSLVACLQPGTLQTAAWLDLCPVQSDSSRQLKAKMDADSKRTQTEQMGPEGGLTPELINPGREEFELAMGNSMPSSDCAMVQEMLKEWNEVWNSGEESGLLGGNEGEEASGLLEGKEGEEESGLLGDKEGEEEVDLVELLDEFLSGQGSQKDMVEVVKTMSREELEELVLVQIVESLANHSEAGKFRAELRKLNAAKEKLQARLVTLQNAALMINKTMKMLVDNHNRDPDGDEDSTQKVKLLRTVGLQVHIEPPTPRKTTTIYTTPVNSPSKGPNLVNKSNFGAL